MILATGLDTSYWTTELYKVLQQPQSSKDLIKMFKESQ